MKKETTMMNTIVKKMNMAWKMMQVKMNHLEAEVKASPKEGLDRRMTKTTMILLPLGP